MADNHNWFANYSASSRVGIESSCPDRENILVAFLWKKSEEGMKFIAGELRIKTVFQL